MITRMKMVEVTVSGGKTDTKLTTGMGMSEEATALTVCTAPCHSGNYKIWRRISDCKPRTPVVDGDMLTGMQSSENVDYSKCGGI